MIKGNYVMDFDRLEGRKLSIKPSVKDNKEILVLSVDITVDAEQNKIVDEFSQKSKAIKANKLDLTLSFDHTYYKVNNLISFDIGIGDQYSGVDENGQPFTKQYDSLAMGGKTTNYNFRIEFN